MKSMKREPVPRSGVYELYWYFASERQKVFEARRAGLPGPWTEDRILNEYKFCNVFRATDRVSQYLIEHIAYSDEQMSDDDRLFQIVAFRLFSRPQTWQMLSELLGRSPRIKDLETGDFESALTILKDRGETLYTGAFILCATNAYGRGRKHLNHVSLLKDIFVDHDGGATIRRARSLEDVYTFLHGFPLLGDFMAYQIAIDCNYSSIINFSENEFTRPGPGALRGMHKVFEDFGDYTPSELIQWMRERQAQEFRRLKLAPATLDGRELQAIDIQGLFCETDKYCREAVPSLKSARSRIKARFSKSAEPVPYFLPPKWSRTLP